MLTILVTGLRDLSIGYGKDARVVDGGVVVSSISVLRPVLLEASIGRGLGRTSNSCVVKGESAVHACTRTRDALTWVISITSAVVIVGLTIIIIRSVQVTPLSQVAYTVASLNERLGKTQNTFSQSSLPCNLIRTRSRASSTATQKPKRYASKSHT